MAQTLSVQELRERLPEVVAAVQNGVSYTLIYRSRPVGQIVPLESSLSSVAASSAKRRKRFDALVHPEAALLFKSRKRSVDLIRGER